MQLPSFQVTVTPTITASSAYSTGNALGGKLTLTGVMGPAETNLRSVCLMDKANQKIAADILFFNQDFTATADKSALAISNADLLNMAGVVSLVAGDYVTVGTGAIATKSNLFLPMKSSGSADLFAQIVTRGTPTYASVSDLQLVLVFERK